MRVRRIQVWSRIASTMAHVVSSPRSRDAASCEGEPAAPHRVDSSEAADHDEVLRPGSRRAGSDPLAS
jgi:hypothetical protein